MYKELLHKYPEVARFIEQYRPTSLIDWGCAQGNLLRRIQDDYPWVQDLGGYDPANPEYVTVPTGQFDCLVSCDVIEHFEPAQLTESLKLMQTKFTTSAFIIVACYPAKKILSDGRNAHLVVENCAWWLDQISRDFDQCRVVWWEAVDYPSRRGPQPELRLILEKV
jgi:hypothetical protein